MSVIQLKPLAERKPGQYAAERECTNCGAKPLSRHNPLSLCAPCQGGDWHSPEELEAMGKLEQLGVAA